MCDCEFYGCQLVNQFTNKKKRVVTSYLSGWYFTLGTIFFCNVEVRKRVVKNVNASDLT